MFKEFYILLISLVLSSTIFANFTSQNSELIVKEISNQISKDKELKKIKGSFGLKLVSLKEIKNKTTYNIKLDFLKSSLIKLLISSNDFEIFVSDEDKTKEELKSNKELNAKIEKSMKKNNPKNYTNQDSIKDKLMNEKTKADLLLFAEITSKEKVLKNGDKEITFTFEYKFLDQENKTVYKNNVSVKNIVKKD